MHWFDINLGRYDIEDRWVGLDYKELFLDSIMADITFIYEASHHIMAMQTKFGQATHNIFKLEDFFTKKYESNVNQIFYILFHAQDRVQEVFATFREISRLQYLKNE